MIVIDWVRVAAVGLLAAALLAGRADIALLDGVLFVINTGEVVFRSASQAMLPAVVPRASLERANGWLVGGTTLMQGMIAGPLGGFLFVLAASVPFFVNTGTYAASAGALLGGVIAARFGITAPFWAGFVVAVIVSASTWRVFNRAAVAQAYAEPG
jgi:hypothetical protein